jgi:hypothetical protein
MCFQGHIWQAVWPGAVGTGGGRTAVEACDIDYELPLHTVALCQPGEHAAWGADCFAYIDLDTEVNKKVLGALV